MKRPETRLGLALAAVLAFGFGGLVSTPTADARTVFHERSEFYMLCDSGRAYLLSGNAANAQMAGTVMARPLCAGQGGWLGEESRRGLRIVRLPARGRDATASFAGLYRSCSIQEERSSAGTVHSGQDQAVLWRCNFQLSRQDLDPYR